jgi:Histidine phosphatase superfamily (branch 2)
LFSSLIILNGAANGNGGPDPFNTPWVPGELNAMGRRQQYIAGKQMREKYIKQQHLLSESFDPRLIWARSQGSNRSMDSAAAFFQGLYPPESNHRVMNDNQSSYAVPQIKVSDDVLAEVQGTLKLVPVPYNMQLVSVMSVEGEYDTFLPYKTCRHFTEKALNNT